MALALAFVNKPAVVFLDEPTTGLDPQSRRVLHGRDAARITRSGHTVLLTTHNMEEATRLCDRVAIIDHGRIIALGTPRDLIAKSSTMQSVSLSTTPPIDAAALSDLDGIQDVSFDGPRVRFRTTQVHRTVADLLTRLEMRSIDMTRITCAESHARGRVSRADRPVQPADLTMRQHLALSLRLYFRNRMALIYGYLLPVMYFIAFWVLYRFDRLPVARHMGELLTVSILAGACFGLPTTMVSERERGVWRRYRLTPAPVGSLIASAAIARYLILITAGLLQIGLARAVGAPFPEHPLQLLLVYTLVSFAFIGVGLVIAMLADNVPAVQALGQCIFLPMLIIGGIAVQLSTLPAWAQHVSAFFPGRYAVEALQACYDWTAGLGAAGFNLLALLLIGAAGCLAGTKMFRWDAEQRFIAREGKGWLAVALAAWVAVGAADEEPDPEVVEDLDFVREALRVDREKWPIPSSGCGTTSTSPRSPTYFRSRSNGSSRKWSSSGSRKTSRKSS